MQQNTFYYQNVPQSSSIQFPNINPNPFPVQTNPGHWSGNCIPETNVIDPPAMPNMYNCESPLPSNVPPLPNTAYDTSSTLSWAHTVPSLMPWVTQAEAAFPDPVVRFTAPFPPDPCTSQTATSWELLNNLGANRTCTNVHLKRKNDIDMLETEAPQKLCITEDKMTARFREMHISNKYSVPETQPILPDDSCFSFSSPTNPNTPTVTNLQQLEAMLKESTSEGGISSKSIILAPELKRLVEPEKIFARTFLDKVERPSMAVVVWQPPNKLLENINNNSSESKNGQGSNEPKSSGNNNNFLSQQISAISNMNVSFKIDGMNEASTNAEDVMDT